MLQNYFSIRQFWLTKESFLVYSTSRDAQLLCTLHTRSHDSILELWRTFPNAIRTCGSVMAVLRFLVLIFQGTRKDRI